MNLLKMFRDLRPSNSSQPEPCNKYETILREHLVAEVGQQRHLLTQESISPAEEPALATLDRKLALLELLSERALNPDSHDLMSAIIAADDDTSVSLVRDLREQEGSEVLEFLVVTLALHPRPEVRKAAASALSLRDEPEAHSARRESFARDDDQLVRESTIYALQPTKRPEDVKILLDQFPTFSERLRREALELLLEIEDGTNPEVTSFFENTKFTASEKALINN